MTTKEIKELLKNSEKIAKESRIAFDKAISEMEEAQKRIQNLL